MTTAHRIVVALIPAGYLIGSVPFGLIVGLCRGVDVRKAGSGNIGATNVGRLLGRQFFLLTFFLDMLKGLVPMLGAGAVLHWSVRLPHETPADGRIDYLLWLAVGFATVLGHMFSIFLGLRGGKGVATSTGVVAGVFPYFTLPVLVAAAVWGLAHEADADHERGFPPGHGDPPSCIPGHRPGRGLARFWRAIAPPGFLPDHRRADHLQAPR